MGKKILVIEDEMRVRRILQLMLEDQGYDVKLATDGFEGMAVWEQWMPDVVLTDLRMPAADGMQVLEFKNKQQLAAPLIIMTAYGTIESAVTAVKMGAFDYLTKPFDNAKVAAVIREALANGICEAAPELPVNPDDQSSPATESADTIIGNSAAMAKVRDQINLLAAGPHAVLLTGESGTGKDLVARAIHDQGMLRSQPFVRVNCPAIPSDLMESKLFGHRKGAFTGAVANLKGCFQCAHKGTLFLDEIGELPIGLQPKLLHAVEDKTITPLGAETAQRVAVRVIAATNRDLEAMIRDGRFRSDLYFRLNTFHIHLPPLRNRREDIDALSEYFIANCSKRAGKAGPGVSPEVRDFFANYAWPGNVRELRNILEYAVLVCNERQIRLEDLPDDIRPPEALHHLDVPIAPQDEEAHHSVPPKGLADQERGLIVQALQQTEGNQSRAARMLQISRNTLRYRIKKYRIDLAACNAASE